MRIIIAQLGLIRSTLSDKLLLDTVLATEVEGLAGKLRPNNRLSRLTKIPASRIPKTVNPSEMYIDWRYRGAKVLRKIVPMLGTVNKLLYLR